jgi:hypothetical protein
MAMYVSKVNLEIWQKLKPYAKKSNIKINFNCYVWKEIFYKRNDTIFPICTGMQYEKNPKREPVNKF